MTINARNLKDVKFSAGKKVFSLFVGNYLSTFKGQGIDYDESRQYVPEDNIRDIDWISTAKTGDLFVKKYIETRELNILFLVDTSSSIFLKFPPENPKYERLKNIVTWISLAANYSGDRLGMALFSSQIDQLINFKKGNAQTIRLLRTLESFNNQPAYGKEANLSEVLKEFLAKIRKKTVCFLITDEPEITDSNEVKKLLAAINKKHQIIIVKLSDLDYFHSLPAEKNFEFQDPETGEIAKVDLSKREKDKLIIAQKQDLKSLKDFCLKRKIGLLNLETDSRILIELIKCLHQVRSFYSKS
jgi:uncharacterized protein (DUF58 family)